MERKRDSLHVQSSSTVKSWLSAGRCGKRVVSTLPGFDMKKGKLHVDKDKRERMNGSKRISKRKRGRGKGERETGRREGSV